MVLCKVAPSMAMQQQLLSQKESTGMQWAAIAKLLMYEQPQTPRLLNHCTVLSATFTILEGAHLLHVVKVLHAGGLA